MVGAYWEIGRQIAVATGDRAEYVKHLVAYLSERLTAEFGSSYSKRNLYQMQQFYLLFPIVRTLCAQLSWSHYRRLMRIPDAKRREFYMHAAAQDGWTVRQLDHQIATFYYERLLKTSVEKLSRIRGEIQSSELKTLADLLIKDPYVLDLGDRTDIDEKTLEQALVTRIQELMLEFGRGFAFIGRQYRLDAETASYYVDLVFYNINLRCHVLVELKTHPLDPRDVGQMDFYVRLFASTYVTYLPTEEELTEALEPTRRAAQEAMRRKEPPEDQSHSPPSTGAAHRARRSDYA